MIPDENETPTGADHDPPSPQHPQRDYLLGHLRRLCRLPDLPLTSTRITERTPPMNTTAYPSPADTISYPEYRTLRNIADRLITAIINKSDNLRELAADAAGDIDRLFGPELEDGSPAESWVDGVRDEVAF